MIIWPDICLSFSYPSVMKDGNGKWTKFIGDFPVEITIQFGAFPASHALNPIKSHETTIFPWFSHGFPMVFPWFSHGTRQWFLHGTPRASSSDRSPTVSVRWRIQEPRSSTRPILSISRWGTRYGIQRRTSWDLMVGVTGCFFNDVGLEEFDVI